MTDLFSYVTTQTDFLTDLPKLQDATNENIAKCVEMYAEQATEELSLLGVDVITSIRLTDLAWDTMQDRDEAMMIENERAYHAHGSEYSTYANAN